MKIYPLLYEEIDFGCTKKKDITNSLLKGIEDDIFKWKEIEEKSDMDSTLKEEYEDQIAGQEEEIHNLNSDLKEALQYIDMLERRIEQLKR